MSKKLLGVIALFLLLHAFAGADQVDSLSRVLSSPSLPDSTRLLTLNKLSYAYTLIDQDKAREMAEEALQLARKMNNKAGISAAYNNLGNVYHNIGDLEKAIYYHLESLKLSEERGDKKSVAQSYSSVANLYYSKGNYDQALRYQQQALSLNLELKDKKGEAYCYTAFGNIYCSLHDLAKALDYHTRALGLERSLGDKYGEEVTLGNIGNVHFENKDFDKALLFYFQARDICKQIEDNYGVAYTLLAIGDVFAEKKETARALEFINQGLEASRLLEAKDMMRDAYLSLSRLYASSGQHEKAYDYFVQYSSMKDSLLNSENTRSINELQTKYEVSKKQGEIEMLKKDEKIQAYWRNTLIGACLMILVIALLIYNRYKVKHRAHGLLEAQNREIQEQKEIIAGKNKDITDSIRYAMRIQEAILPQEGYISRLLPESFVLFRPKDIISGDFYWLEQWGDKTFIAAVDCTGHGVPGAMMSMVGVNLLSKAVNELGLDKPSLILNSANKGIIRLLRKSDNDSSPKDGMDIALCAFDFKKRVVEYAGAYNPLYLFRKGKFMEIKADRFGVGMNREEGAGFTNHALEIEKGDMLYLFSDGLADQFGGEKGEKFKLRRFRELLGSIHHLPVGEQKEKLQAAFDGWKGSNEQVDDVLVIGIRV